MSYCSYTGGALTVRRIEERLAAQLGKDRQRRSNILGTDSDGTVRVKLSNTALGFAMAIEMRTGEDAMHVIDRVSSEVQS